MSEVVSTVHQYLNQSFFFLPMDTDGILGTVGTGILDGLASGTC